MKNMNRYDKQKPFNFPAQIYVQQAIDLSNAIEAYSDISGVEEDDTVAVYKLVSVCRVKKQFITVLVPESEMASYNPPVKDAVPSNLGPGR